MNWKTEKGPKAPSSVAVAADDSSVSMYWVQEGALGAGRQAVIHVADCPFCEDGKKTAADAQWYGPFPNLTEARAISDTFTEVAMRAECRCVRKAAPELPKLALLNEPLFRKPEPAQPKPKEAPVKKQAKPAAERKRAKARRSKAIAGGLSGAAAIISVALWLFVFPSLSVVEASNRQEGSPFVISNNGLLAVSDVNAECTVELQPAAVRLQRTDQQLADRLASNKGVTIPCFQAAGGSIPQTSGTTVLVTVRYAVLGIHHATQTFSFVAARTTDGFCKWALKS